VTCYQCNKENPDQAFCGACGSPLALSDYIAKNVKEQLGASIRDRDVLEAESSLNVFNTVLGWAKNVAYVFGVALAAVVGVGIWKYSDLLSSVEGAKQAVVATSNSARTQIERSSAQSAQEMRDGAAQARLASGNASVEAVRQTAELKKTALQAKTEMSREATSLRSDFESSRTQLESASKLTPEIEALRSQLAQANKEIENQRKTLSSSQDFVRSVFSSHTSQDFVFKLKGGSAVTLDPLGRYAVIPLTRPEDQYTVVLMLLPASPIQNTLQLQQRVAVQPRGSYFNIHNLVVFNWGDAISDLVQFPLNLSYFPDRGDQEIITSLTEHDGRIFADDQPLPKYNAPDPDFKGNKWMLVPRK
jgi:hypothetical protein